MMKKLLLAAATAAYPIAAFRHDEDHEGNQHHVKHQHHHHHRGHHGHAKKSVRSHAHLHAQQQMMPDSDADGVH